MPVHKIVHLLFFVFVLVSLIAMDTTLISVAAAMVRSAHRGLVIAGAVIMAGLAVVNAIAGILLSEIYGLFSERVEK
jgi:hypothetical protein